MSEEEFLEILTDVFHEFEIKSSSYSKYNKDYTKFYIKKLVPRFKGKFSIAVVNQLFLGTTLFECGGHQSSTSTSYLSWFKYC